MKRKRAFDFHLVYLLRQRGIETLVSYTCGRRESQWYFFVHHIVFVTAAEAEL